MLTKAMLELLHRAALGQLPRSIDQYTPGVDLQAFKGLHRAGLIEAVDASADCGDTYLEPVIALRGHEVLEHQASTVRPWWASFDRRVTIVGLLVAVLGLAVSLGLFTFQ